MTDLFETIRQTEYISEIKKDPRIIFMVDDPIESLQLTAIEYSCSASILLSIPPLALTYNAQLAAVKKWGDALRYIGNPHSENYKNPHRNVIFAAVTSHARAILHIERPSRRLQLIAVKLDPGIIRHITCPCVEAELYAWNTCKILSRTPCKEVQLLVSEHKLKQVAVLKEKHNRKILQDKAHVPEKKTLSNKWRNFKLNKGK